MKTAKLLWSSGSLLINITGIAYIVLSNDMPIQLSEKFSYINDKWAIYSLHWKAEFVSMTFIAIAAFYFTTYFRKLSWSIVTLGLLIQLPFYPIMLGGYYNTSVEIFSAMNQIAIFMFIFGNCILMAGLFYVYFEDNLLAKWLRVTVMFIAALAFLSFGGSFLEFWTWKQALILGPLLNVLYLVNAYYGIKIKAI